MPVHQCSSVGAGVPVWVPVTRTPTRNHHDAQHAAYEAAGAQCEARKAGGQGDIGGNSETGFRRTIER